MHQTPHQMGLLLHFWGREYAGFRYQGDRIAYGSTKRTGNDVDIWVVRANDPASARMVAQMDGGGWAVSDWSPDGKQLLAINDISAAESYVWLIDVDSGKKELLTP